MTTIIVQIIGASLLLESGTLFLYIKNPEKNRIMDVYRIMDVFCVVGIIMGFFMIFYGV